ncbi:hypothetical protein JXA32_15770 [Candidatus Sumerlaeota bacterium]|nr:hypothetical protein [Candidatus Sumerlaeota bacterium]
MRGWDLDPQTRNDLRDKGMIKNYSTSGILLTSAMPLDEILLIPDEENRRVFHIIHLSH